jgi:hypothetical protein
LTTSTATRHGSALVKYAYKGETVTYFADADAIAETILLGGPVR